MVLFTAQRQRFSEPSAGLLIQAARTQCAGGAVFPHQMGAAPAESPLSKPCFAHASSEPRVAMTRVGRMAELSEEVGGARKVKRFSQPAEISSVRRFTNLMLK
jgi:hypothetical protein